MTSTIKADAIEAATGTNTDLTLTGKGSGVVNLEAGSKLGGTALTSTFNPYVAPSTSGNVLTSNGSAWTSAAAGGGLLQTIKVAVPAASGTTTIPADDTAPTISEGTQIGTQAITLASTSSKVIIQGSFEINMTSSYGYPHAVAVFRGSTCIGVAVGKLGAANYFHNISFSILDEPATAGSVTYSFRTGATSTNTWLLNGSGGNDYGGLLEDQVYIMEVGV